MAKNSKENDSFSINKHVLNVLGEEVDGKKAQVGKRSRKGIAEGRLTSIESQLQHIKKFIGYGCTMGVKTITPYAPKSRYVP